MTPQDFVKLREELNTKCEEALKLKGEAYTQGSEDRLANFKEVATDTGLTPLQVWAVYFHKHIKAIDFWLKSGKEGPEGVTGNFLDARNYIDLGVALYEESKTNS